MKRKKEKPAEVKPVSVKSTIIDYDAIPTFTGGGFVEGQPIKVNCLKMSDGRVSAFMALSHGKSTAYAVFANQTELEEKLGIKI